MRSFRLPLAIGTAALTLGAALGGLSGNVGCSDFPPITTDPAFASSPGSPGRGIGGPGLGNSGASPSNPSLNQPAGVGTQNPGADPLPGTNGAGGASPGVPGSPGAGGAVPGVSNSGNSGNPGATGTFGGGPAGSARPVSAELDISEVDASTEPDESDESPTHDPDFDVVDVAPDGEEEPHASRSP